MSHTSDSAVHWTELLEKLARPFPVSAVSWRAGAVSRDKKRAQALPYAEPRVYEDRLNELCPGSWEVAFRPWGENRIICELSIHGLTRSSTGEFEEGGRNAIAQGTAAEAQAFKRACSKFGLGRYLYDIPIVWVDYDDDKKRLGETPALTGRFVPPAAPLNVAVAKGGTGEATLAPERAEAMRRELEKVGVSRRDHLKFAGAVLGRSVGALTELNETEALEIWNVAKRSHQDVAV